MKNIIIAILGTILALLLVSKTYSGNGNMIAEGGDWTNNSQWSAYKIFDGDTRCYVVMGASGLAGERPVGISCVRVK